MALKLLLFSGINNHLISQEAYREKVVHLDIHRATLYFEIQRTSTPMTSRVKKKKTGTDPKRLTIEDDSKIKLVTFQAFRSDVLNAFITISSLTNVVCEKRRFNAEKEANN